MAISKLKLMLEKIEPEILNAIRIESSLESANSTGMEILGNSSFHGAKCLNTVQRATAFQLAISLAKLFECPLPRQGNKSIRERRIRRWDNSDIASIPLLVNLLRHLPCQLELVRRARDWTPSHPDRADLHESDCKRAISGALKKYGELLSQSKNRRAMKSLKEFRDGALAHIRTDVDPQSIRGPNYQDLFRMANAARIVAGESMIAVLGRQGAFDQVEKQYREASVTFWRDAFRGVMAENAQLMPPATP